MSIFAKPKSTQEDDVTLKVLFLHGLEGSPAGVKASHLKSKWGARVPMLRSDLLRSLRSSNPSKSWHEMPKSEFQTAWDTVYDDVLAAIEYSEPEIIVGSSMGGALLARLVVDKKWQGPCVFLAPAIEALMGSVSLPEMKNSVWILGELDTDVPNKPNVIHCLKSGGNLMLSMGDDHRLHSALQSGMIDSAIVTVLELESSRILF